MISITDFNDDFYSKVNSRYRTFALETLNEFKKLKQDYDAMKTKLMELSDDHERFTAKPLMERPKVKGFDKDTLDMLRLKIYQQLATKPDKSDSLTNLKTLVDDESPTDVLRDVHNLYVRLPSGGGKNGKVVLLAEGEKVLNASLQAKGQGQLRGSVAAQAATQPPNSPQPQSTAQSPPQPQPQAPIQEEVKPAT
jgi:hypothetical protein